MRLSNVLSHEVSSIHGSTVHALIPVFIGETDEEDQISNYTPVGTEGTNGKANGSSEVILKFPRSLR